MASPVSWTVLLHEEFESELQTLDPNLQDELLAHAKLLQEFGPNLGRPTVDTLKGSRHANMKELRFGWRRQTWRVAFAFDPRRRAVLLAAADKTGADQRRFYERLIATADRRFGEFLAALEAARSEATKERERRGKKS
jgi:hypothetical protein